MNTENNTTTTTTHAAVWCVAIHAFGYAVAILFGL
jgi:hypothetical protein